MRFWRANMALEAWSKGLSLSSWSASFLSTEYQMPRRRLRRPPLHSRMKMPWWVRRTKSISARRLVAWWARPRECRHAQRSVLGASRITSNMRFSAVLWAEEWMVSGSMRVMARPGSPRVQRALRTGKTHSPSAFALASGNPARAAAGSRPRSPTPGRAKSRHSIC